VLGGNHVSHMLEVQYEDKMLHYPEKKIIFWLCFILALSAVSHSSVIHAVLLTYR
jgi:hypothetical protein